MAARGFTDRFSSTPLLSTNSITRFFTSWMEAGRSLIRIMPEEFTRILSMLRSRIGGGSTFSSGGGGNTSPIPESASIVVTTRKNTNSRKAMSANEAAGISGITRGFFFFRRAMFGASGLEGVAQPHEGQQGTHHGQLDQE